ncbi:hypothetical protein EAI_10057 [Harpegnathos saltator]|uniref:C2H2-type domain-containing protein n=1 Tax=Harpegnathos saltator TaxID=610380 RepID=E2BJB9_HARSA|nr:hypothetical protein EAI_10057 [Harpegnathos saltator]
MRTLVLRILGHASESEKHHSFRDIKAGRVRGNVSALSWPHKREYGYGALYQLDDSDKVRMRIYVCPNCGKGYAVKRSLWRHRKFECINPATKFSCEVCSYESPYKWRVDNHSKKHDVGYKQYFDS